ncbi:uncharacterized protein LOC144665911 [Oculina patagonica]
MNFRDAFGSATRRKIATRIKKNTPHRYHLYFVCIIAVFILIFYSVDKPWGTAILKQDLEGERHVLHGFTFSRNLSVNKFTNESRELDKTASKPCLKDAFKDILLVIVYNYPFYDSIPHLVALYKPAFPNLLFCGPPDNTSRPGLLTVDIIKGFLGYECLGRAIRQHPGYKGYFYINDDVILKYWNFPDFDREKIWESDSIISYPVNEPASTDWYWLNTPYGLKSCERACEDVRSIEAENFNGTFLSNTLLKNSNGTALRCFGGRADVLYIPRKHAKLFATLSETFYKQKVFLEIAVPTINRFLEGNENIGLLPGSYIPGGKNDPGTRDGRFFWYLYLSNDEYCFIHPFKLHREELDSKFNLVMFKYILIEKVKALTNCKANTFVSSRTERLN